MYDARLGMKCGFEMGLKRLRSAIKLLVLLGQRNTMSEAPVFSLSNKTLRQSWS